MKNLPILTICITLILASCTRETKIVGTWKLDVAGSKLDPALSKCRDKMANCSFEFEANGDVRFNILDEKLCDPKVLSGEYSYDESKAELETKWKSVERRGQTQSLENSSISKAFPIKLITDQSLEIEIGTEIWHLKKQ